MELRQLRYFVTLAEHLHFARAAEALDLAPSALSMQLQTLERQLGVRLVARTKRSVALTAAGQLFLAEARNTLEQASRTEQIARRAGRGEVGTLQMGYVISAACAGVVQGILSAYRKQFPDVRITLQELESPLQIQLLYQGKLDACIVRTVAGDPDLFDRVELLQDHLMIALPHDHLLACSPAVQARDLINETFITPQFQREFGFARHLLTIGQQAGFTPHVGLHTRDFMTALTLVASGFGVAAVPASLAHLQIPGVVYLPLADAHETSALTMVFRRNEHSPLVMHLRRIAQALVQA
ncbi:DNA-binding transcriptional LysR family regulator [Silvimonas terrae]|uniref:DNA-binding transcriptional LysR family regulator n=1 Tax=Silvimonas terrae TaxID=300266 RepID=A0A840RA48_9NEIS|nr:LysR substrate-binding domain-containing protein [Silvimonas terrae]MBB5189408.1 DNA-binding transcriptional LysR family regulator [Silvimonas terrae]